MSNDRPVVLFDGHCGFCTWSVEFARRAVRANVEFIPYQSVDVAEFGLSVEQCAQQVQFVGRDGAVGGEQPLGGERAVAAVLMSGRPAWRALGAVIDSPIFRPVSAVVYRLIARHRGRLWGVPPALSPDSAQGHG